MRSCRTKKLLARLRLIPLNMEIKREDYMPKVSFSHCFEKLFLENFFQKVVTNTFCSIPVFSFFPLNRERPTTISSWEYQCCQQIIKTSQSSTVSAGHLPSPPSGNRCWWAELRGKTPPRLGLTYNLSVRLSLSTQNYHSTVNNLMYVRSA